jgi:two-component system cell cycle response regulator CtrA
MRVLSLQVGGSTAVSLEQALRGDRRSFRPVECPNEAIELVKCYNFDVMLIGPGRRLDARPVLRVLRAAGLKLPILVLTAETCHRHRVECLDLGADDCLTMPAATDELMARLRAIGRRSYDIRQSSIQFGDLVLNMASQKVTVCEHPLSLTPCEYRLLQVLFLANGRPRSKSQLLSYVYPGEDAIHEQAIVVLVCRLRKRLSHAGSSVVLETFWGLGYGLRHGSGRDSGLPVQADLCNLPLFSAYAQQ